MVLLTPKFVFVAALASLTAFSLAPTADAAAIAVRRNHRYHPSDSSGLLSGSSLDYADHPTIPLPARLLSASGKQTRDGNGKSPRGSFKRQSPRDFFASQRRSLTPEDLPPLLTRGNSPHQNSHHSHEHGPPLAAAQQLSQEEHGTGPYVHIDGANSHVAFGRRSPAPVPDPRHHNHHHHHGDHHDDHSHGSKHTEDVVVVKGDNDNVHIGRRSPLPDLRYRHDHDHHRHSEKDAAAAKENHNIGRRSPEPRHDDHRHHHHHNGHGHGHRKGHGGGDKVIIKGDDNNVSVHSRSRITRHQRHDYSPARTETIAHEGHQHPVHARKYIPRHESHHDGSSTEHAEHSKSPHHGDQDRTEKHSRSVLINSVEGEEKYLVPDDCCGQRVTVIEGDGISKILTKVKREDAGIEGVPGSVEIMSQSTMSEDGQRIASLVLVHPDSTMAEFGNNSFILNASENNSTQLYLVALNTTDSGVQGEDIPVALKVPMFNPDSASMEGYCATYDPQPPAPAPLSAEPCSYDEPAGPHKSQVFAYTPSTSVIRPMWFNGENDEEDSLGDPSSNSTAQPDATVDPGTPSNSNVTSITDVGDFGNSTTPSYAIASFDNSTGVEEGLAGSGSGNDSMVPSAEDFAAKARNVTLVFTPAAPVIPSSSRTSPEDLADLDETPLSGSNSTDTDTSATPLTSSTSGQFNDTETGWTGSSDDNGFPATSIPVPYSVPSETVSPAAVPSQSGASGEDKDLNVVMVGVARDRTPGGAGARDSGMKAVSTAPYKWKFDRERP